ncbi:MAG TPA: hypothetical protein VHI50_03785 [Micromonosporaceae bacterium]|nr:hypothetical protein [Micromonosporaceae bacterium]
MTEPDATEATRLDAHIRELAGQLERARLAYDSTLVALNQAQRRRNELAARMWAARPAAAPPAPPAPAAPGPESSVRAVQNVLFVLGGLLLGTAAVVFTAVAYATFGVVGRAAILAAATVLTLGVPPLALRRGLVATAETFAALGLLLVALDGYAAWRANLLGLAGWPGERYAALVCAFTAAVSAGYAALAGLAAARFGALIAAQPVLPLLATAADPSTTGWAGVFAALAVLDLLAATGVRRAAGATSRALGAVAWALQAVALALAAGLAAGAVVTASGPWAAASAGAVLVATGVVFLVAAALTRVDGLLAVASVALVVVAAVALGRWLFALWPSYPLAAAALGAGAAATAAGVAAGGPLRSRAGALGARVGGGIAAGAVGLVAAGMTAYAGLTELALGRAPHPSELSFDWQLPVAVALLTAAFMVLLPTPGRWDVAVAGSAVVVVALPSSTTAELAVLSLVDVVAVATLAVAAVLAGSGRLVPAPAAASALLAVHAVLVGNGSPAVGAAVLGALAAVGVGVAVLAAPTNRTVVGGLALAGGLVAVPAAVDRSLAAAGVTPWWTWRASLAAAALTLVAVRVVCGGRTGYAGYALAGLGAAAVFAGWPRTDGTADAPAVYAAVGLLVVSAGAALLPAGDAVRPGRVATVAVVVSALGGLALVDLAPVLAALLLAPYRWVDGVWTGPPSGVGPGPGAAAIDWPHAAALAVLAAAAALAGHAIGRSRRAAAHAGLTVAPFAVVATLAAARAPWPAVPAASLVLGLGLCLVVAYAPRPGRSAALGVPLGVALAGAGLAGALPAEATTLAALALLMVAGAGAGAAGRALPARLAGWSTAAVAAALFALAAGLAAELPLRRAAFGVLGAAAAVLCLAVALRRRGPAESAATEAMAHATAFAALVLAAGAARGAAAVCTLWGIAVGVRALWPAESHRRRLALAAAAAGCELLAWWLLLGAAQVALVEAYTLPAAGAALLAGWLAQRDRPVLSSWVGYGPALAAALLPTLATVLVEAGGPVRRLLLGAGALAVVVVGAVTRRQAPVVAGGIALAVLSVHELVLVWDLLPRWIPLAVGGLVLVELAITYERRRRDMSRLRGAVGRMS